MPYLRPDAKSQVTIEYDGKNEPKRVDTVVISTQHDGDAKQKMIKEYVIENVIKKIIPAEFLDRKTKYFVNPTGKFEIGGPHGDAGLTGRNIIVDTYGGFGRHGGGAFSGKDPSKVDRSACYMCRYIAKNIVAGGLADRCEVQVAYAIGIAEPVSLMVNTFDTGKIPEEDIENIVRKNFDMRPSVIISQLDLKKPFYRKTAAYGHFGRNEPEFKWENTDKANLLRQAAGL